MKTDIKKFLSGSSRRIGFTLAEVLLVITVIGCVASVTIPDLITSTNNAQYEAELKKDVSVIAQAYKSLEADGIYMTAAFPNANSAVNILATKLNVINNCGSAKGCLPSTVYYLKGTIAYANLDSTMNGIPGKAVLADGTMIRINVSSPTCTFNAGTGSLLNTCGYIWMDVNGAKGPNKFGRDIFEVWITATGIIPMGSNGDGVNDCNIADYGYGCASQVLIGGMNY